MTTSGLKQRKRTRYARLFVPRPLRPLLGKSEIMRSLKTRDLAEANRRKHAILAALHSELEAPARGAKGGEAAGLVALARDLRVSAEAGDIHEAQASAALDHSAERVLDSAPTGTRRDAAEGEVRAAFMELSGEPLLTSAIADYLAERATHIRKQTLREKERHLTELSAWLGPDCSVRDESKVRAGRYVSEKLLQMGHSRRPPRTPSPTCPPFGAGRRDAASRTSTSGTG